MGLDEHGQAEPVGELVEVGEDGVVGDGGDDEQDRVGADGAGLEHLDLVDHEVFAQHRQRAGLAGAMEVVDRAAEVRAVGEDGEGRGPALGVGGGGLAPGRDRARGRPSTASAA